MKAKRLSVQTARALAPILAATLGAAVVACATTPIQKFLETQAPGFRALEPVSSEDVRGMHLPDPRTMIPTTNRCFRGIFDEQNYASFGEYRQSYAGGLGAGTEIARDFGPVFGLGQIEAGGGRTFNGTIVLGQVQLYRLTNVYFDPSSVCAQENDAALEKYRTGTTATVLTRVLRAGSIAASSNDGSHLNLAVTITEFGGRLATRNEDTQSWTGTDLFFAALPQTYRITLEDSEATVGLRQATTLGRCGLTIQGYSPVSRKWNGSLACEGGESFGIRNQSSSDWASIALPQGGVSYGIKVAPVPASPGLFAAKLAKWTVREVPD